MLIGSEAKAKHSDGLLNGVIVLTASTLISKVIGLLFKIPIIGIVGIDGMAYFSAAYNIYMLLNSVSAAGLPVALSILISKNIAEGKGANVSKIFSVAMLIFAALGTICTVTLYFGAEAYSEAVGMKEAATAVKAISPTLLFICFCGGIRGYFQGFKLMNPTAVSQLLESGGKLILGIAFAYLAVSNKRNSSDTAAAAVAGLSLGVLVSLVYLLARFIFSNKKLIASINKKADDTPQNTSDIIKALLYIALPITLSSCITSLTGIADTALITNRLVDGGISKDVAVTLYSSYTNLAIPLFNLPPALIAPIAVSLVPSLTSSIARQNVSTSEKIFLSSVKLCNLLAIPAAAGLAVFAKPILFLIYPAEREACSFAAPLLTVLAVAIVFSCLITVFNAVLQAYMKPVLPIIAMAIGAIVKILAEYFLVGSKFGTFGAPISTIACTFTILVVDLIFVNLYTPHRLKYKPIVKIFIASALSVSISAVLYHFIAMTEISNAISLFAAITFAVIFYVFFVLLMGLIHRSDIIALPFGSKIADILYSVKLIKE